MGVKICSINGAIIFYDRSEEENNKPERFEFIDQKMKEIIVRAEARGRDSYGVVVFDKDGKMMKLHKKTFRPSYDIRNVVLVEPGARLVMNNNRAEPTTEYVANKTTNDVQPFRTGDTWAAHNGTIANDKDLEVLHKLMRTTQIDSAIIPALVDKEWNGTTANLVKLLRDDLIGSYAVSIYSLKKPNKLFLAVNYKPLYIHFDAQLNVLFFSSLEDYMVGDKIDEVFNIKDKVKQVRPYSLLEIDMTDGTVREFILRKPKRNEKKRALVICSSGLDSTVCASWALNQKMDVELLHFKYGCRATTKEEVAVKQIAEFMKIPVHVIETSMFRDVIKHSRLTNPGEEGDLVKTRDGEASAELAWEWVPARNLVFMSIATAFAEARGFDYIILGGNLEESGAYPDNELIFQRKFNEVLPYACNLNKHVEVLTPVANLMKHEIVKMGLELGTPLHLAWSCYEGTETPCKKCGPCYMRRKGFKMNGVVDMQADDVDNEFWKGCKKVKLINGKWIQEE